MRAVTSIAAATLLAAAVTARADDPPSKRSEGKYYIQLSEVMLSSDQFDVAMGHIQPTGARASEPGEDVVAELSHLQKSSPRFCMGLNRPSGKTALEFSMFNVVLADDRIPVNFDTADQTATTTLLPPGVIYQRQLILTPDWVPNVGDELAFIRRMDYKSAGVTLLHNIKEGKLYRLRWLGGLKYAEIDRSTGVRMSFLPEILPSQFDDTTSQDFFSSEGVTNTHGFGPNLGMDGRFILDKKRKKWSIEARGEVAMIPETSTASYAISMVDFRPFYFHFGNITIISTEAGAPIIPGLGSHTSESFNAQIGYQDYTSMTSLMEGRIGFRFHPSKFFTVGLDVWQLRWNNLLSDVGVLDTVHRQASYEQVGGDSNASDPQLRDVESIIHVPRFTTRDNVVLDGFALDMKFDF